MKIIITVTIMGLINYHENDDDNDDDAYCGLSAQNCRRRR
jgi:hypothetical protein